MRLGLNLLAPAALPFLMGAQVATVRGPSPAPGGAYVLHAVVPTPASVNGPIFVGSNPTESAVIGSTRTHKYHEVWAYIASGGTGPFAVNDTGVRPSTSMLDAQTLAALTSSNTMVLMITDGAGDDGVLGNADDRTINWSFPLTGPAVPGSRWIVDNNLAKVGFEHVSLGRFGKAQVWFLLRGGLKQIDVIINWHTASIGSPDVLFRSARVIVPAGVVWKANLADPASESLATQAGFLVRPTGLGRPHIIPMMHDRAFRLSIYPSNVQYKEPWSWNGMAVWTAGGIPPAGFKAPAAINGINLVTEAAFWRDSLRGLRPQGNGGAQPVSPLWPAMGAPYGGLTSGEDMIPFEGTRWLVTGQNAGFERYATEQLRMQSRTQGSIVESDGSPVRPWEHLSNGQATWRYFNSVFEAPSSNGNRPMFGPFVFPTTRLISQAAYNPEFFAPTDCQHAVRGFNQNAIMAIATADPLARHYLKMEARKSLMTYWHGTGDAARFGNPPSPGMGVGMDRGWCWAAICMANDYVWSTPAERAAYDPWIQKLIDYLALAQMTSGCFGNFQGAKEEKLPPYGDNWSGQTSPPWEGNPRYRISSGLGECYFAATLACLETISDYVGAPPAVGQMPRGKAMLQRQAAGLKDLAWSQSDNGAFEGGVWYTFAIAPVGATWRYSNRDQWPQELRDGMFMFNPEVPAVNPDPIIDSVYNDGYHVGYVIAALKRAGAPQADELLFRFTGRQTVADALAAMASWGSGGTPPEQFTPAMGQWAP